jgi:hypothetical protein
MNDSTSQRIFNGIAETSETSETLKVDVKNQPALTWWDKVLIKYGRKQKPKEFHEFEIRPMLVGNRYRISTRVEGIPEEVLKTDFVKLLMTPAYITIGIYCAAVGIQNDEHEPDEELLNIIRYQFDDTDLFHALDKIFKTIAVKDFINSIILMKGTSVLNVQEPVANDADLAA